MRYLMNITYDGGRFYGYQIQKNEKTIEGDASVIHGSINAGGLFFRQDS